MTEVGTGEVPQQERPRVNIEDVHRAPRELAHHDITVAGQGVRISKGIKSLLMSETSEGMGGKRTMVMYYAGHDGKEVMIGVAGGPLRYDFGVDMHGRDQFASESDAIDVIQTKRNVRKLEGAARPTMALYETAAPGLMLHTVMESIAYAVESNRLSPRDASLILGYLQASSSDALRDFHRSGLEHNHANLENFIVDVYGEEEQGQAQLVDYTQAKRKTGLKAAALRTWVVGRNDRSFFMQSWDKMLESVNRVSPEKIDLRRSGNDDDRRQALKQLAPAVLRYLFKKEFELTDIPDPDIATILDAMAKVKEESAIVDYPRAGDSKASQTT